MSLPNKIRLVATVTVDIEYADSVDAAFKEQLNDFALDPARYETIETQILEVYKAVGLRPALTTASIELVKEALMEGLNDIVTPAGERDDEVNLDVSVTIKAEGEQA